MIFLLPDHRECLTKLENLGLTCVAVPPYTVQDILDSVDIIGKTCHVEDRAHSLRTEMSRRLSEIRKTVKNLPRPKVMLSIGRDLTAGKLDQVFIAGSRSFHQQLLEMAGGRNVLENSTSAYSTIGPEGIIQLNPRSSSM